MSIFSPRPSHCLAIALGAAAVASALPALAQDSQIAESRVAQSEARPAVDAKLEERPARDWGLQAEEWTRYRHLMRGPTGIYSPNLDPLTALGIEARSDQERRHYAELQVRAEARRVEKTLAYQRAYDDAWKRINPGMQPVNLPGADEHSSAADDAGRLAVFVKDNCPACAARVKELQGAGSPFDLYLVGSRQDDARVREWATQVGIDPAKVRARVITLNHDAGRWLSIGGQGELPAVVTEINGQWQRR
jgi:integrating conjugative element protein (TIGR03759 family)